MLSWQPVVTWQSDLLGPSPTAQEELSPGSWGVRGGGGLTWVHDGYTCRAERVSEGQTGCLGPGVLGKSTCWLTEVLWNSR